MTTGVGAGGASVTWSDLQGSAFINQEPQKGRGADSVFIIHSWTSVTELELFLLLTNTEKLSGRYLQLIRGQKVLPDVVTSHPQDREREDRPLPWSSPTHHKQAI